MMLAAYFDQYPAHLAAAARRQASPLGEDDPCPLHSHDSHYSPLLSYPLMASVPEEKERSEGGRTYTVSSNSDRQEEEDMYPIQEHNGDEHCGARANGDVKQARSPRSSPSSDDLPPKKTSFATTSSYHTARGKSSSDLYYTGRESSERSSPSRDRVYDPTRNIYIPRDPECPVHSPKGGSPLRSSPIRTTPTRESPSRTLSSSPFNRHSPTRLTPPRTSPIRSSISRVSPTRGVTVTSPRVSPSVTSLSAWSSPTRPGTSRSSSVDGPGAPMGPVHPSRASAADSELLQCTICAHQFCNPKVLPCLHTFCQECLLSTTPAEALTISCPMCRQQSILPQAGVRDLQSNSWVQGVIDSLKKSSAAAVRREVSPGAAQRRAAQRCCVCDGVSASHRCLKCASLLCRKCLHIHKNESEHEDYECLGSASQCSETTSSEGGDGAVETAETAVTVTSVADSPTTLAVAASESAADTCASVHADEAVAVSAAAAEGAHSFQDETRLYCPSHEGMTLRFYCRDCDTAVCISCTDIEHRMHATMRLSEAMHDQTNAMHSLVDAVGNKLPAVNCCIEDLDEAVERLAEKRELAEQALRATFSSLRELLDAREKDLLAALHDKTEEKKDTLEAQKSELQQWVSAMESGSDLVRKAIQESKAPMELVLLKKQFGDRLKEHVNADLPPGPRENSLLSFEAANVEAVIHALSRVGRVVSNPAVPYTTIASGDHLRQAVVGRKCHITVISRDFKGERVGSGGAELTATFATKHSPTPSPPISPCSNSSKSSYPNLVVSAPCTPHPPSNTSRAPSEKSSSPGPLANGHSATNGHHQHPSLVRRQSNSDDSAAPHASHDYIVKVNDHHNGVYDIEYVLQRPGRYTLDINLYGMPIDQSPFTVTAITAGSSCSVHGSEYSSDSPFGPVRQRQSARFSVQSGRTPKSSRHTPSQRSSGSRITMPLEDDLIFKVGIKGRNKGEFVNPQGICYSNIRGGRIVVTDSISQCVQVFTSEGEFKTRFGTRGRNVGQMQRPTGIATLPNGNYAVADYENKCVSIFEPNGKYIYRIGQGKLLGPKGVCADRQGNIIVVDNKGSCVCIFQSSGRLITKFGNRGTNNLQFAGPHFVAVSSQGHIVTTDFHNHCVKVFDSEGEFLFTFGCHGEGNGQFNAPTGIAVDDHDNIIVADWGNCRIQVFDSRGSFLSFVNTLADPLHGPQGLTYTEDGHVVVADSGNHCYKVYKYLQ